MSARGVTWILAMLSALFGVSMMASAAVALHYHTGHAHQFLVSGSLVLLAALLTMRLAGPAPTQVHYRDGFLIVSLAWLLLSILGAVPFWTTGVCHSLMDGIFESASGLTTTGATVLVDLDHQPPAVLFWRSMLQWFGGMGIIVLAVAILPMLGAGGMQLMRAEVPGPVKDKLTARVTETAKALWALYLITTAVCALVYWAAGMSAFDAVNHAMTTISTGGFSTHDASFGFYPQPQLHLLATLFMFLAGINFALHFAAIRRGFSPGIYWRDEEFRAYLAGACLLVFLIGIGVVLTHRDTWIHALFTVISIATTTGFTVSDYSIWPPVTKLLLLMAMFVGACAGSTSGGMKVVRVMLLFRQGARELRRLVHPHAVLPLRLGRRRLSEHVAQALWGFAVLFFASFFLIAVCVAATGVDMLTSIGAAAACITNTGPGFADVGPALNYAFLPDAAKGALVFGMILGRLEIYTLIVLLVPDFWRI